MSPSGKADHLLPATHAQVACLAHRGTVFTRTGRLFEARVRDSFSSSDVHVVVAFCVLAFFGGQKHVSSLAAIPYLLIGFNAHKTVHMRGNHLNCVSTPPFCETDQEEDVHLRSMHGPLGTSKTASVSLCHLDELHDLGVNLARQGSTDAKNCWLVIWARGVLRAAFLPWCKTISGSESPNLFTFPFGRGSNRAPLVHGLGINIIEFLLGRAGDKGAEAGIRPFPCSSLTPPNCPRSPNGSLQREQTHKHWHV